MGQAKKRGNLDERIAQSRQRQLDAQKEFELEMAKQQVEGRVSRMSPRKRSNMLAAAIIMAATMNQ